MKLARGSLLWIFLATLAALGLLGAALTLQRGPWWVPVMVLSAVLFVPIVAVRLICYVMGWHALACRYPQPAGSAPAWRDSLTSIALRRPYLGMNNCIAWASDDHALHLMLEPPFGWGMPKVTIPWSTVQSIQPVSVAFRTSPEVFELVGTIATPLPVRLFLMRELVADELVVRERLAADEQGDGAEPMEGNPARTTDTAP